MAISPQIKGIFGDSPASAQAWAVAILTAHRAALETEHKLAVEHGDAGEISALPWISHAAVLDAAVAMIEVASLFADEA